MKNIIILLFALTILSNCRSVKKSYVNTKVDEVVKTETTVVDSTQTSTKTENTITQKAVKQTNNFDNLVLQQMLDSIEVIIEPKNDSAKVEFKLGNLDYSSDAGNKVIIRKLSKSTLSNHIKSSNIEVDSTHTTKQQTEFNVNNAITTSSVNSVNRKTQTQTKDVERKDTLSRRIFIILLIISAIYLTIAAIKKKLNIFM